MSPFCIDCGAYVPTQYARRCDDCMEAGGSLVRQGSPNKASLSLEGGAA